MSLLVSVDPGVHQSYVATFVDGALRCLSTGSAPLGPFEGRLVCEVPEVYAGKFERDLINLALAAGRVCALHPSPEYVRPAAWKGSVPKRVHNARVISMLSDNERKIVYDYPIAASLRHNLIDSVGIGLWALDRKYTGGAF